MDNITGRSTDRYRDSSIAIDNDTSERDYAHEHSVERISLICRQQLSSPTIASEVYQSGNKKLKRELDEEVLQVPGSVVSRFTSKNKITKNDFQKRIAISRGLDEHAIIVHPLR